jgi:hypothetical protein
MRLITGLENIPVKPGWRSDEAAFIYEREGKFALIALSKRSGVKLP